MHINKHFSNNFKKYSSKIGEIVIGLRIDDKSKMDQ